MPNVKDYTESYRDVVKRLLRDHSTPEAMSLAVGGQFEQFGVLMRQILLDAGLKPEHYLIDVGCGSGRLAHRLHVARYLGTDVVPEFIDYARAICHRPDWRFEIVEEIVIPEGPNQADMVCFFSVFTHLLHEDTYRYLREAHRVLRPGGKVVFSFLEFRIGSHWDVFAKSVGSRERGESTHHNQFISRDGIESWAQYLSFKIETIHDGDVPHIEVPSPLILDDGRIIKDKASLGQSVCVLLKNQ